MRESVGIEAPTLVAAHGIDGGLRSTIVLGDEGAAAVAEEVRGLL